MNRTIVHLSSWARSAGQQDIELYSSLIPGEKPLLFVGGVHGDEPEGVKLAHELLFWLQKNNSHTSRSWILIPCLNVDGFSKNERVNARGVDLNRNFPAQDWSPEHKAPRYYPGENPGSEPETQALIKLIEEHHPEVIIHFHSWQPCVVYTGATGQPWAELIASGSPYQAREDIGYPTPGSLGQYGWLNHKTPVVCIEEQEGVDLDLVWSHFGQGLIQLLSPSAKTT
jgi:predicted deacylase